MAEWPASGVTDWNTKMLAYLAVEHNTDGTHSTAISAITKYDSDWFAVSKNVLYTKAHGLGAIPTLIQVWFSDASDGTGDVISITSPNSDGIDRQASIVDVDSTNIKIRGDDFVADYEDGSGTRKFPQSGYAKIIAILIV